MTEWTVVAKRVSGSLLENPWTNDYILVCQWYDALIDNPNYVWVKIVRRDFKVNTVKRFVRGA